MHEPHIYVTIIYTKVSHGDVSCCGIRADIAHLWHRQVLLLFHLLEIGLLLCVTGILLSLQFKLTFVYSLNASVSFTYSIGSYHKRSGGKSAHMVR